MQNALEIKNLSKSFPGVLALNQLSFNVKKGAVHGLLGPNGAGKSTTMKIIAGSLAPSEGEVILFERQMSEHLIWAKSKVGYLPENPPLYTEMRVEDYLDFVAELYRVPERKKRVDTVMEQMRLGDLRKKIIAGLSKGQKQRVGMAQAIVPSPDLLILDEPTVGLDPQAILQVRELIQELRQEHTLLLSTHLLHEVTLSCSDISIVNKGKLVKTCPLSELTKAKMAFQRVSIDLEQWRSQLNSNYRELYYVRDFQVSHLPQGGSRVVFELESEKEHRPHLISRLVSDGLNILEVKTLENDLEQIFLDLVGHEVSA